MGGGGDLGWGEVGKRELPGLVRIRAATAEQLGISQMHVSRLLTRAQSAA